MATTVEPTQEAPPSPYEMIGGREQVAQLVEAFYDLMERDPAYQGLRAMHAPDLTPMRKSLTGFLSAWLGGPRDWFEENPGKCMMSAHASLAVTKETAQQWVSAMTRALDQSEIDTPIATAMGKAFEQMANGMVRPG